MSGYTSAFRTFDTDAGAGRGGSMRGRARALWARLVAMRRAAETRRELGTLNLRLLSDIGVSRAEAAAEAERWPWDTEPRRVTGARR